MNNVTLIGRITRNIEIRKTQTGASVCDFTLAVNRKIKQEGQPEADFIGCIAWNKTADLMFQYLHKGSLIGVIGKIQTSSYENKNGDRVYKTHVVAESVQFLEPKTNVQPQNTQNDMNIYGQQDTSNKQQTKQPQSFQVEYAGNLTAQVEQETLDISSEDLPF